MPRRKKQPAAEPTPAPERHTYKIKTTKHGFELYRDGEWLETFQTEDAARAEEKHRQDFDSRWR